MSTKRISPDEAKLRAQSKATLAAQRRIEAETALEEMRIEAIAVRERTARLRALRLMKEAAEAETAAVSVAGMLRPKAASGSARKARRSG